MVFTIRSLSEVKLTKRIGFHPGYNWKSLGLLSIFKAVFNALWFLSVPREWFLGKKMSLKPSFDCLISSTSATIFVFKIFCVVPSASRSSSTCCRTFALSSWNAGQTCATLTGNESEREGRTCTWFSSPFVNKSKLQTTVGFELQSSARIRNVWYSAEDIIEEWRLQWAEN